MRFCVILVSEFRQILMIYDTSGLLNINALPITFFDVPTSVAIITLSLNIMISRYIFRYKNPLRDFVKYPYSFDALNI